MIKKLGITYFVIAFVAGLLLYGESRYLCIKEEGFLKGYFVGCDNLALQGLTGQPMSLTVSQFKGLLWPYQIYSRLYSEESANTLLPSQTSVAKGADADINDPKFRYCVFLAGVGAAAAKGRDKGVSKEELKRQIGNMEQINTDRLMRDSMEVLDFVYSAGKEASPEVISKFVNDEWCMGQPW
jgi:hypothetical protein